MAAKAGIYVNFNGIELSEGEAAILQWDNGTWVKKISDFATKEETYAKFSKLEERVYSSVHGKNLFNKNSVVRGYFINSAGGFSSNADYFYSDAIPVKPNASYYINKSGSGAYMMILGADMEPVETTEQKVGIVEIPENGYYLVVSSAISYLDLLQVEAGSNETSYEEFYKVTEWYNWYRYAKQVIGGDIKDVDSTKVERDSYADGFLGANGAIQSNSSYATTDYIEIPANTLLIDVIGIFTNQYGAGVAFYDENKTFISSISEMGTLQGANERYIINVADIPSRARYIRSCAVKKGEYSTVVVSVCDYNVIYKILKDVKDLKETTSKNSDDISSLQNVKGKNLFDKANVTEGYFMGSGGGIGPNAGYFYSDYISVKANETYYINKSGAGGYYAVYDESKNIVESKALNVGTITIPNNGYYIRISSVLTNLDSLQFELGTEGTSYEEYYSINLKETVLQNYKDVKDLKETAIVVSKIYKKESFADLMSEGDYIEIPNTPNLKNKHSIAFHANVVNMCTLRVSHGTSGHIGSIFDVDETNIKEYDISNPTTLTSTIPHGLSISEYIHIQLRISDEYHKGTIILTTSNGQSFSTKINWNGCSLNAAVNCLSGSYSKAKLIFGGNAWKEKVWVFGDSYTDYWPQFMVGLQATNFLLDGFSGRGSAAAYTSFVNELEFGEPSIVLWMMGMNNADTADAINSSYKDNFDKVKTYCDSKGIVFVPCTIPNVPERIHVFKNQYIKNNSQYYIDMAKILGAEETGSSWNTGLLSNDKVHPTFDGAKLIAQTLCEEMPQILNS
jgi:lysophospholipase L1-like esterase